MYEVPLILPLFQFCVSTGSIGTGKRDAVISDLTRETDVSKDRKKKDVLVCSECCDDALCNSGGCGTEGRFQNILLTSKPATNSTYQ